MFAKIRNKLPKWAKYQNFSWRVVTFGHESKDCIILTRFVVSCYFEKISKFRIFIQIIGGMCWAIQMCNVDLDIDIFYQETLSIGQKM